MNSTESFGRLARKAHSPTELLELEHTHGRYERFAEFDILVGEIFVRSLRGERLLVAASSDEIKDPWGNDVLHFEGITAQQRARLEESFSLNKQQSRGTWSLPDEV